MAFLLCINLYTSRIVLNVLGVTDYGVQNVVGGVVALFTIVTASLSQSISRFLTYELGKGDIAMYNRVFCSSINVQILSSVLLFVIMEPLGLWLLKYKLIIPPERLDAAMWVLQTSILIFILNLVTVPYISSIVAHEDMKAFAYTSIFEAIIKLLMVYTVQFIAFDKLIVYSCFMLLTPLFLLVIYILYVTRKFKSCEFHIHFDKEYTKKIISFAGWNYLSAILYIANTQGINIITNMFFGVNMNAARGITNQVESTLRKFMASFSTAINPQITKSYSNGDNFYMFTLLNNGTKYSYFLLLIIVLPIFFEMDSLLRIWLGVVPEYSALFVRITIVYLLVSVLGDSLFSGILAVGNLKAYMIVESIFSCLVFPLTYFFFSIGYGPYVPYLLMTVLYFSLIFVRLFSLRNLIQFPVSDFIETVLSNVCIVSIISSIPSFLVCYYFEMSIQRMLANIMVSIFATCFAVYFCGLNHSERTMINNKTIDVIRKFVNHD